MKKIIIIVLLGSFIQVFSQRNSISVLFVGNSYTSVNNLPQLVKEIANSMGDDVVFTANTPGGCTFSQHCTNQSMTLIRREGWDYVVLQEQSQLPSFPIAQVRNECFPYAAQLVDAIYEYNPCAVPVFYMTWGRKNGDLDNASSYPPLGTYEGMDSLLYARYMMMKQDNDAAISPVGSVWRHIRNNYPDIELYSPDESHPSMEGSYAAACTFYTIFFQKNPKEIRYDSSLDPEKAQQIRNVVKTVVYDTLNFWLRPQPIASFEYRSNVDLNQGEDVLFTNNSVHATSYNWDFGDGTTTTTENEDVENTIVHHYNIGANDSIWYTVTLVAIRHCMSDTIRKQVLVTSRLGISEIHKKEIRVFPNPANRFLYLESSGKQIRKATLLDMVGRTVIQETMQANESALDIDRLPKGIYLLQLDIIGEKSVFRTVIKE